MLKKAIWFEENKDKFSSEERDVIRKTLFSECKAKIKVLTAVFVDAIDDVNG